MKRTIKNLLRVKNIHYYAATSRRDLDEDVLWDYCAARDLSFEDIRDELERLGYNLI